LQADNYWGTHSHNTFFRNFVRGWDPAIPTTGDQRAINLEKRSLYYNVVGNVLGSPGANWVYEAEGVNTSWTDRLIYKLGYESAGDDGASGNDPQVKATLLRHGNYDHSSGRVVWDPQTPDTNLPASLVYAAKPDFFGELDAWPPIGPFGPDGEPLTSALPAQLRYEGIPFPYDQGAAIRPAAPTNLRVLTQE
jgi:hypothetical protein